MRVNSGLMVKDDMANLGLGDVGQEHVAAAPSIQSDNSTNNTTATATETRI